MFHMWRRSAATQMAASGAGTFALKVAGRWRSVNTEEIYVAESLKREQDVMRDGRKRERESQGKN